MQYTTSIIQKLLSFSSELKVLILHPSSFKVIKSKVNHEFERIVHAQD